MANQDLESPLANTLRKKPAASVVASTAAAYFKTPYKKAWSEYSTHLRSWDKYIGAVIQWYDGSVGDNLKFVLRDGSTVYGNNPTRGYTGVQSNKNNTSFNQSNMSSSFYMLSIEDSGILHCQLSGGSFNTYYARSCIIKDDDGVNYFAYQAMDGAIAKLVRSGNSFSVALQKQLPTTGAPVIAQPITAFIKGDSFFTVSVDYNNSSKMRIDEFSKADFTPLSSKSITMNTAYAPPNSLYDPGKPKQRGDLLVIPWGGQSATQHQYVVLNIATMQARAMTIPYVYGGSNINGYSVIANESSIFVLNGSDAGGSSGHTGVYEVTATGDTSILSVSSGATSSASSWHSNFRCTERDTIATDMQNPTVQDSFNMMHFRKGEAANFTGGTYYTFNVPASPTETARTMSALTTETLITVSGASYTYTMNWAPKSQPISF